MGFIFPVSNDFYSKVKMAQDHYEFVFKINIATDKTEWRCITFYNCVQVVVMTRDKTHPKLPSRTKGDFF